MMVWDPRSWWAKRRITLEKWQQKVLKSLRRKEEENKTRGRATKG